MIRFATIILSLFFLKCCYSQKPNMDNKRHDVYVAGFFPYRKGVENSETGRGVMPSVKLALDHVNEHSSVLRNYRLHMWWNDTMCNAAVGVKAFFDMMHSGPHKLMLFGAACTHVTDPIAKASKHWHLTQLSYADTHPMFTKENFPNFFRIVPSENAFNSPRLSLLKEFNWTKVATIYQNEPRYSLAHNRLVAELDAMGYQVLETQSFTNEVNTALTKLKEKDTRIILGNFDEVWARNIFCEAYKLKMYGKKYQWIIMGTYSFEWWKKNDPEFNCTLEELEAALQQTILTDLLPLSTSGEITISGITADEYNSEYETRRGEEYSRFHGYTYDGIWALALAIQNVAHKIKYFRRNESVTDFRYRDPIWERLFLDALHNTSFEGVTGPVRFYDNERKASILLKQFQDGREVKVGEYSAATQHLDLTLGEPLKWIGKHPPKDRTLVIIEHTRVNKTVYAILATLAVCGIIMAIVFLAFNIKYRNQRYIKMSSPQLNNLIIIGCMLTYTSIIFLGLDSGLSSIDAFPYICTARAWTLMAGFSLAFGAMFSKTWRVHSIFTDVKLNKKVIKDYQLFMVVGVLLVIDLIIMTTWQFADPFYRDTKQMERYMLIRRLGNEAKDILDSRADSISETNRLSVPLLRKEPPSATETSDLTSLCSLSSQDYATLQRSDSQKRRKLDNESPKRTKSLQDTPLPSEPQLEQQKQLNGTINQSSESTNNFTAVNDTPKPETDKPCNYQQVESTKENERIQTPTYERKESKCFESETTVVRRRSSVKPEYLQDREEKKNYKCGIPSIRTTPKKKTDYGTHVVTKSELWDTGSQHRCMKSHQKSSRVSLPQEDDDNMHMHRTVSERNRYSSPKEKRETSPIPKDQQEQQRLPTNIYNQQCNKLGYFQSTPNVHSLKNTTHTPKRDKSMCNANSESELLDREILPIFQKLLTERNKSQQNIDYSFGRSCPNISIKCDIVEYL
ncbi:gamma-aminobutyric acid type B receptor subunit 2 isoform X3 [Diorhabda sublineata]|uniref:gamma-aminobutyric acid type B receptor subunit 2 isoform X3 n=1 Tax=Diorhabda sublineata TaxID=1163346 RepID=UPI0024E0854A|nr:gamma-aminobutyric acid type B receptor subunit 2 isoform X3 [Diorhabda sublineata]